jgi:alanine racemase
MYNCYLETDLNRLEQNIINIRKLYSRPVKVMCVLKANAYGHGIEGISRFLDRSEHTHIFAVANAEEALNLKNSGIQKPVLVLSGVPKEWAEAMITHDIRFTVYDMEDALFIQNTAKRLNKHAFPGSGKSYPVSSLNSLLQYSQAQACPWAKYCTSSVMMPSTPV